MANIQHITNPADQLGELRSQIAALRVQEKEIEDALKRSGIAEHEGDYFRATVSNYDRASVAWKDVAAKFNPSQQLVTAHTTHSDVWSVKVSAKITAKAA